MATKKSGKIDGLTELEKKFIDYKGCDFEKIYDYVSSEKQEYLDFLEEQVNNNIPFLAIKKAFYQKYFPDFIPVGKPKKPTMKELIALKKAEQKK